MEDYQTKTIIIYDGSLSNTKILVASIMYTFVVCIILFYVNLIIDNGFTFNIFKLSPAFISVFFAFLVPAINNSEEIIVEIDMVNEKIITTQKIVFYKKIKIIDAVDFEYVALNNFGFGTIVTLWYLGNRKLRLISFYRKEKALKYAKALSSQLNINLLDKTDLKKPIWIDKSEL